MRALPASCRALVHPDARSDTDAGAIARLRDFWNALGSKVEEMDPVHHDKVLAIVSHLPHIIAYNIVGTADDLETVTESEVIKYSASGFRDFTRLASRSDDVAGCVPAQQGCDPGNAGALFRRPRLSAAGDPLGDGEKLFDLFTRTRAIRRSIIEAGQDTAAPNFGRNGANPELKAGNSSQRVMMPSCTRPSRTLSVTLPVLPSDERLLSRIVAVSIT